MAEMRKVRVQDLLCMFPVACCLSCSYIGKKNNLGIHNDDEDEFGALMPTNHHKSSAPLKLKDLIAPTPTLAFQLIPKMVVMKVSMHCNGCAKESGEAHIKVRRSEFIRAFSIGLHRLKDE